MKKKQLLLILLIVILLGGGGLIAWKISQKGSSTSQPGPSNPSPPTKLTPAELEKYLLEKRLDLQKYFVFSLKELKTMKEKPAHEGGKIVTNWRFVSQELSIHLTELASSYGKLMEKKGHGYKGTFKKELICFNKDSFKNFDDEYTGDSLDQKITNEKNLYLIFEKYDDEVNVYFDTETDKDGKIWLNRTNLVNIRVRATTTTICKSKEEAIEKLKTDPALIGRI